MTVDSYFLDRVKPFRVKMSCGHVETRMMREALAGMPFDPNAEFQLETDRRRCENCREDWE